MLYLGGCGLSIRRLLLPHSDGRRHLAYEAFHYNLTQLGVVDRTPDDYLRLISPDAALVKACCSRFRHSHWCSDCVTVVMTEGACGQSLVSQVDS